jgi:hypothetical protein
MYFSAERLALVNQTVKETFEQCSVAWQTIPHWDTGDPSQTEVQSDSLDPAAKVFLDLTLQNPPDFTVTLAQAIAPTPDELLEIVIANTVQLAAKVDADVFPGLLPFMTAATTVHIPPGPTAAQLLTALIQARVDVENGGYRAPSCLVTDTLGVTTLSTALLAATLPPDPDSLLAPANINSLERVNTLAAAADVRGWLLGRRQRIAAGGAADASAGEEAVDLAVSVPPSLEVVGDTANLIQLRARIRYATRVKDPTGLVVFRTP